LTHPLTNPHKLRIAAVSYLNTVPLVWGMLHGDQRGLFDLEFCLPSECADRLTEGRADIGIVPSAELERLDLEIIPGAGIASRGAVRSILLVTKVPREKITTLAADTSSRTSVQLARVLLARNHRATPKFIPFPPDLGAMLAAADAALIIGDPALRVGLDQPPYRVYDLGAEWTATTNLPMVFAVWGGRRECVTPALAQPFLDSCRFGLAHMDDIVRLESGPRGLPEDLVREYFSRNVRLELGEEEYRGLDCFLRSIRESGTLEASGLAPA
jgi:predicted solute-binding protein